MMCNKCLENFDGDSCPGCYPEFDNGIARSGSPTLIKGLETPYRFPIFPPRQRNAVSLAPLLWVSAMMIAIPWIVASNQAASVSYPSVDSGPSSIPVAAPVDAPDRVSMVVHVPADHWIDTGIEMCGCTQLRVRAEGAWDTPTGDIKDANGTAISADQAGTAAHALQHQLTKQAAYGELIGKVGADPYFAIGSGASVDGDTFNSSGTLKIGMNARRMPPLRSDSSELTVFISGSGSAIHTPEYSAAPAN